MIMSKNLTVHKAITITVISAEMTANDWQLYNADSVQSTMVASLLNQHLEYEVFLQKGRDQVRAAMLKQMELFGVRRTTDTTVHDVLEYCLDEIFGK